MRQTDVLDALAEAVYTTDAEGRITYYNQAAAELWGHRPELGTDRWCGSWKLFWLDGRPLPHDECPMAMTLKQGRPVRGYEAFAERPDGIRIRFRPYPTPLFDAAGKLIGAVNLLMDVTDRHELELELARLAAIVTASDDAIISKTLDGHIVSWNEGASRIFGYSAEEAIGRSIMMLIPQQLRNEEFEIIAKLKRGERIEHFETVRIAKDGRKVDISLSVSPVRDRTGRVVGASKIARDVGARKEADRIQRLLMDELNHRVKNTLATVQAIASQSSRHSNSPADFVAGFSGRIQALARAHSLLMHNDLQGAELGAVVRDQVMLGGEDDERIGCEGPYLRLDSQAAVHLALVLHELGTNARKYGALSRLGGRLKIDWKIWTNGQRYLTLQWKESGGPKVAAPSSRGFGSTLIEHTLRSHGGTSQLRYDADGVACEIRLPLPELSRGAEARFAESAPAAPPRWEMAELGDLASKRILIVEDEPLLAMDIEGRLEHAGCKVVGPAGTLASAKKLIAEADFDAAVIDVNLAGLQVDELAVVLTQKAVPFAFMTGYGREALPRGFQDALMLSKPFSDGQLRAVLESMLRRDRGVVPLRRADNAQSN